MSASEGVGTDGPFPAPQFSEVVLKTSSFARMKDWYENLLQVKAFFVRDDAKQASWTGAWGIAFIRLYHQHPYTQVLGLFEVPAVSGKADGLKGEPGLHHMQLRHQGLDHLFSRFEALRVQGIVPERAWNHGPGTSFYYRDPTATWSSCRRSTTRMKKPILPTTGPRATGATCRESRSIRASTWHGIAAALRSRNWFACPSDRLQPEHSHGRLP